MIIAGVLVLVVGMILITNQFQIANKMAAFSRQFPWWLKGIGADSPTTGRLTGAAMVIVGAALVAIGIRA